MPLLDRDTGYVGFIMISNSHPQHSDTDQTRNETVVVVHQDRSAGAMAIKRVVQMLFLLWIAPRLLAFWVSTFIWGRDRAFLAASESIARVPGMRGVYARQAFYRRTLAKCGQDIYFGWGSTFAMPAARVGDRAYIGRRCGIGFADIGSEVMLADGAQILSGGREHGMSEGSGGSHQSQPSTYRRLKIGQGAWVGTNSVVMADIGEGAIVGAGAVVNAPVPARTVAVGVPAKVIRKL